MGQIKRHHATDAACGVLGALDSVLAPPVAQSSAVAGAARQLAERRDVTLPHLLRASTLPRFANG